MFVFKRQAKWSGYLHSYCEWYISFMPPNQVLPKLLPMPRRSGIFYPIARAGIYCWGGGFWANIGIFLYSINLFIDIFLAYKYLKTAFHIHTKQTWRQADQGMGFYGSRRHTQGVSKFLLVNIITWQYKYANSNKSHILDYNRFSHNRLQKMFIIGQNNRI